ncbi:hypothetical protein ACFPYI_13350 [Halomarina salina]|uniref:Multidrug transporter n=1 Tax=Halomarina salina TaxID=1872699 RepID=A0ABD5RP73_9EURY|nr:hypothetical protein [Halomarina salina]
MPSTSTLGTVVGLATFAVGLVGYTLFGWRFDGTGGPVVTAVALVCVVVAVVLTLRNR